MTTAHPSSLLRAARFAVVGLVAFAALVLMDGCGSGSGGTGTGSTGGTLVQLSGRFVAPAGFTAPLSTLTATSAFGSSPVQNDGSYHLSVPAGQSSLVWLQNASGKPVLCGFSRTPGGAGGAQTIDITPKTTAVAMLFWATGAYTLGDDNYDNVIGLLTQTPQADDLAATINSRVASNPTAIGDGDAQIGSKAQSDAAAIVGPSGRAAPAAARVARVTVSRSPNSATRAGGASTLVTINNAGPSSGVQLQLNSASNGIVAVNNYRRWCTFYVYQTATVNSAGVSTPTPGGPKELGTGYDLPSTSKLDLIVSLQAVLSGSSFWASVQSDPVVLPLVPGSTKTVYDIILTGPSLVANSAPIFNDPNWSSQVGTWKAGITALWAKTVVLDFLYPVVKYVLGVNGAINPKFAATLAADIAGDPALAGFDSTLAFATFPTRMKELFGKLVLLPNGQVSIISQRLLKDFAPYLSNNIPPNIAAVRLSTGIKVFTTLAAVDVIMNVGDLGAVIHDLNNANATEDFQATAFQPIVSISPGTAILRPARAMNLSVTVPGFVAGSGAKLSYHWNTTGGNGELSDRAGKTGLTFDTDQSVVQFTSLPTAQNQAQQTITVDVNDITGGGSVLVGSATATITIDTSLTQHFTGRFLVDASTYTDQGFLRFHDVATIAFPQVPNARSYHVVASGFSDPYVASPDVADFGPDPSTDSRIKVNGPTGEYYWGIAGGDGGAQNQAADIAYYQNRFKGMVVDVTVYY